MITTPVYKPAESVYTKANILLIDDEESICIGISDLLNSYNYSASYAQSAEDGMHYLDQNSDVDIILLDINLGTGMTGVEAISAILEKYKYIQIIMLTSHDSIDVGVECMKKGAYDYLTKPFDENKFFEMVPNALEKKKLAQLSDLYLGILVHDMNNPLNNLSLGLDLLQITLKSNLDAKQNRLMGVMEAGIWEIKNMVKNILNVNKFESGGIKNRASEFNLKTEVDKNLQVFDGLAHVTQKNIDLNYNLPDEFTLYNDQELFAQVLGNLVSNSLRYCNKRESIHIEIGSEEDDFLKVKVTNPGSYIPEELQSELFGKFYNGDSKLRSKSNLNFGLGLTYSKMAVEAMGGSIWVESQETPPVTSFIFKVKVKA